MNLQIYNNKKNTMYNDVYEKYKHVYSYHSLAQYPTSYEDYLKNNLKSQEEYTNINEEIEEYSDVYNFNEWYQEYYYVLENTETRKVYDTQVLRDALILKSREEAYRNYVKANSQNYYQTMQEKIKETAFKLGLVFAWWIVGSLIIGFMFEDLMINPVSSLIIQFLLVIYPLTKIVKDVIKYFSERKEKYRLYLEKEENIKKMWNGFNEYQRFVNQHPFLRLRNTEESTTDILLTLKTYLDQGRADNLKEAQNLFAEEVHRNNMLQKQNELIAAQEQIRSELEQSRRETEAVRKTQQKTNELLRERQNITVNLRR